MQHKLVNSFVRDNNGMNMNVEIFQNENQYTSNYYINGNLVRTEKFDVKDVALVENAIENWFSGIKVLNG